MRRIIGKNALILTGVLFFGTLQAGFPGLTSGYHVRTLALAGAGSVITGVASDRLNPAALETTGRQGNLGWLRYPAGIQAGLLAVVLPGNGRTWSLAVRQLDYGDFDGYDEDANSTGSYSSSDTWLTVAVAGRPVGFLRWGIAAGIFLSQLEEYQAAALTVTPGVLVDLERFRLKVGISVRNLGTVIDNYTAVDDDLPTMVVLGVSRRLAYLPLELTGDVFYRGTGELPGLAVGGVFTLAPGWQLRLGTSADKVEQGPGDDVRRDFLAASGLGLSFQGTRFSFDCGGYFYGPGGWVTGAGLGVAF
ncbi:MAG: hypothetical protein ABIA75_02015 [Candidatus Neomarinimicrobiota bacterium]